MKNNQQLSVVVGEHILNVLIGLFVVRVRAVGDIENQSLPVDWELLSRLIRCLLNVKKWPLPYWKCLMYLLWNNNNNKQQCGS